MAQNLKIKTALLATGGFFALWLLLSGVAYTVWVKGADHRDFYPRWAGARLALFQHQDLYAPETTRAIQITLYGAPLPSTADQQGFAYPAILVVVLLPFWFIGNVEIATAAWIGCAAMLFIITLLLLRQPAGPPEAVLALYLLWYFPLLSLFQGQVTALVLASTGLGWWAFRRHRDLLAGAALAVGLVKPQLVLFPLAAVLLLAIHRRRFQVLAGFGGAAIALLLASMAAAGFWIPAWLLALTRYQHYAKTFWALGALGHISLWLAVAFSLILLALLRLLWQQDDLFFAASIPAGMLLLPQTLIWGLAMLLIPLTLLWHKRTRIAILGIWALGWLSLAGNLYFRPWWQVQGVVFPLLTLGLAGIAWHTSARETTSR